MKALIAFIGMALVIIVLIEINERVKAKKAKGERLEAKEGCEKKNPEQEDCSGCGLVDVCEKEEKKKTGR